jgi:hypothetical protein
LGKKWNNNSLNTLAAQKCGVQTYEFGKEKKEKIS